MSKGEIALGLILALIGVMISWGANDANRN